MGTQAGTPTYFELRRSSGSGLHREEMLDVRNSPYPRIARRPISYGSSGITGTEDVNLEGYLRWFYHFKLEAACKDASLCRQSGYQCNAWAADFSIVAR